MSYVNLQQNLSQDSYDIRKVAKQQGPYNELN